MTTSAGKYRAVPLKHPVNTYAAEKLLKRLTSTPATGVMARSAVVQDKVGTVKLAADTVADPARTTAS